MDVTKFVSLLYLERDLEKSYH